MGTRSALKFARKEAEDATVTAAAAAAAGETAQMPVVTARRWSPDAVLTRGSSPLRGGPRGDREWREGLGLGLGGPCGLYVRGQRSAAFGGSRKALTSDDPGKASGCWVDARFQRSDSVF